MLDHRLRRWSNIESTLDPSVFAGLGHIWSLGLSVIWRQRSSVKVSFFSRVKCHNTSGTMNLNHLVQQWYPLPSAPVYVRLVGPVLALAGSDGRSLSFWYSSVILASIFSQSISTYKHKNIVGVISPFVAFQKKLYEKFVLNLNNCHILLFKFDKYKQFSPTWRCETQRQEGKQFNYLL